MNANTFKLKLATLAVIVAAANVANAYIELPVTPTANADAVTLLPDLVGDAQPVHHWKHPLSGAVIEEGALYQSSTGGPLIQLDFYRNSREPHNGAACYLLQGERLRSESLLTVQTRNGAATFDVMLSSDSRHLRLAAATECTAEGCTEQPVLTPTALFWRKWDWRKLIDPARRPVVPTSIVLLQDWDEPDADRQAQAEQEIQQTFVQVAREVDLEPARRLASALQADHS